jgi:preprotein translocase subunit SecD
MAAMALALAWRLTLNANQERVREELRNGASAQAANNTGYERAWATTLDLNITLMAWPCWRFCSGPVRGFAVVHCIGILTSMFSAVFSRVAWSTLYECQKNSSPKSSRLNCRPAPPAL